MYMYFVLQRVLQHQEDSSLLKAYIAEWGKFFTQCDYLPKPFMQLVTSLAGKPHGSVQQKKTQGEESLVRKVCGEREIEREKSDYIFKRRILTVNCSTVLFYLNICQPKYKNDGFHLIILRPQHLILVVVGLFVKLIKMILCLTVDAGQLE